MFFRLDASLLRGTPGQVDVSGILEVADRNTKLCEAKLKQAALQIKALQASLDAAHAQVCLCGRRACVGVRSCRICPVFGGTYATVS
jgi:hypothetical protein